MKQKTRTDPIWQIFIEGDDYYDSLTKDIRNAKKTICMESYIFEQDEIGSKILNELIEKSKQGVNVRLLVDGVGSFRLSNNIPEILKNSAVELHIYRRVHWKSFLNSRVFRRNHRKLTVIDESICYIGGMNFSREHSKKYYGTQRWRDTMIRIEGGEAIQAQHSFDTHWERATLKERFFIFKRAPRLPYHTSDFLFLERGSIRSRKRNRRQFTQSIRSAKKSIYIETAYFAPRIYLLRCLKKMASAGVDVRLLLSKKSDIPMARLAGQALYSSLLKSGVQIYEYRDRFLHAKAAVIDGSKGYLGSSNLDYKSDLHNEELDIYIRNIEVNRSMEKIFLEDIKSAKMITLEEWRKRPILQKLLEKFFYLFRYYL